MNSVRRIFFIAVMLTISALGDIAEFLEDGEFGYIEKFGGDLKKQGKPKFLRNDKIIVDVDPELIRALVLSSKNLKEKGKFSSDGETVIFKIIDTKNRPFRAGFTFSEKGKFFRVDKKTRVVTWISIEEVKKLKLKIDVKAPGEHGVK